MTKFLCLHTVAPGSISREQAEGLAHALQQDPVLHGYRSFLNLSEGKVACIIEGPDKNAVANWFKKMNVPVDGIYPVEFEGEYGSIHELEHEVAGAGRGESYRGG